MRIIASRCVLCGGNLYLDGEPDDPGVTCLMCARWYPLKLVQLPRPKEVLELMFSLESRARAEGKRN